MNVMPFFPANRWFATGLVTVLLTGCASAAPPSASVAAGGLRPLPAACGGAAAASTSLAAAPATDALITFDTAWAIIRRTHWDTTYNGVNWLALRDELRPRAEAARTRGELRLVLSEMVGRLKQSHFSIIPQEVSDATSGAAEGGEKRTGASGTVGFDVRLLDSTMVVVAVDTGGSAWQAGVRPGWTLETVAGCPVAPRVARIPSSPSRADARSWPGRPRRAH